MDIEVLEYRPASLELKVTATDSAADEEYIEIITNTFVNENFPDSDYMFGGASQVAFDSISGGTIGEPQVFYVDYFRVGI